MVVPIGYGIRIGYAVSGMGVRLFRRIDWLGICLLCVFAVRGFCSLLSGGTAREGTLFGGSGMLPMRISVAGTGIPVGCGIMVRLDWKHADLDESQQVVLVVGGYSYRELVCKPLEGCVAASGAKVF